MRRLLLPGLGAGEQVVGFRAIRRKEANLAHQRRGLDARRDELEGQRAPVPLPVERASRLPLRDGQGRVHARLAAAAAARAGVSEAAVPPTAASVSTVEAAAGAVIGRAGGGAHHVTG